MDKRQEVIAILKFLKELGSLKTKIVKDIKEVLHAFLWDKNNNI